MDRKGKGTNAERELVHLFWKNGWAAIRVAGSGSNKYPSPDIIAGKPGRVIVVECKSGDKSTKYLTKKEVLELIQFGAAIGAEPWIGVRIDREKWVFLPPTEMKETNNSYVVSSKVSELKGLTFEELTS